MVLTPEQKELGYILNHIAEEIDIPDSKYKDVIDKYEAITKYLVRDDSYLSEHDPYIFIQGSFKLGTCVKPLERDEYDIDIVCRLIFNKDIAQAHLYNLLGDELKRTARYKEKLEAKNRCWRVVYAGDFHMDILPAIPDDGRNDGSLLIPDKQLADWKCTNPEGYAEWFYDQMKTEFEKLLFEARADVEDVPKWKIKTPLQRAIQILKRHRDVMFKDDLKDKPVSIIISTLAAKAYNNESNLYEALRSIITGMREEFDSDYDGIAVYNPTNENEDFTDKWSEHPQRKQKFLTWLNNLESGLEDTLDLRGLERISKSLQPLFEEAAVKGGIDRYAKRIQNLREEDKLRMEFGSGYLGLSGLNIRKNTFYGD